MLPLFIIAAPERAARTAMATATIAIAREISRDSRTIIPYNTTRDNRFKDYDPEKKNHDMDSWVLDIL
jgi:malate/lactate dehydrogenase